MKMEKHRSLDKIDRNILHIRQKDGRISNVRLANAVNLSPTHTYVVMKEVKATSSIALPA